jgi:phosphatidylglycerol---prolipoprotein diacylglyceryl transferase
MHPVLLRWGTLVLPSHEALVLLGVLTAMVVFFAETRRRGVTDERLLWVVAGALVTGALGAKLATAWRYVAATGDASVLGIMLRGGRSILGGLMGAYVGVVVVRRAVGYRRRTGDLFAPAVALGMAVGRWGCFLTEQPGTPTTLPWGFRLSPEVAARIPGCASYCATAPMHPSFVYEVAFHAAAFVALRWWLAPRVRVEGDLWKIYLLAYALFRFFVEFVRGNEVVWRGLTRPQLFLIPATLSLAWYFARQRWPRLTVVGPQTSGRGVEAA